MKNVVFQFHSDTYDRKDVEGFSFEQCLDLFKNDFGGNITRFNMGERGVEELLNDNSLDTVNCWFRIFTID